MLFVVFIAAVAVSWIAFMTAMPGRSYRESLPPLSPQELESAANLKKHVVYLAGTIGERNVIAYQALERTRQYIEDFLSREGYQVRSQEYVVQMKKVRNLIVEISGASRPNEIVVIGAHYDTVYDCPGADDNSSGVAALLELARLFKSTRPSRTLRFVAFVNEEPPWFQTGDMGSLVYARQARKLNENIVAAVSLETIGWYSDKQGSQQYPLGFGLLYPSKGDFITFIGNVSSRHLVRQAVGAFRETTKFPSEGAAVPTAIPGIGWSDHWSFWNQGYPAIMVTDTAPFRNPNYHMPDDKPETLDYEKMGRVVRGLEKVVGKLGR
ncbi:MAG TPA: M28 family peptidase [Candidatus Angelobacter sp.]|nr:M28 family peptidase [Candidatus Angelobacter sp.]